MHSFFFHYFQRMRSGWSFSIFLSSKITHTRHNGPITRVTWIKVFIKGSKTAKQFTISKTVTAIATNNLDSESEEIKYIYSARFTCYLYLSLSFNVQIFFNIFCMCDQRPNIRLVRPRVFSIKKQTRFKSLLSFFK